MANTFEMTSSQSKMVERRLHVDARNLFLGRSLKVKYRAILDQVSESFHRANGSAKSFTLTRGSYVSAVQIVITANYQLTLFVT